MAEIKGPMSPIEGTLFEKVLASIEREVAELSWVEDSCVAFEEARRRIGRLNVELLPAIAKRSKYPLCAGFFEKRENIGTCLECGLDSAGWTEIYRPFLEKICSPGEVDNPTIPEVIIAERGWQTRVIKRTFYGMYIVADKIRKGIPIEIKPQEEKIIKQARMLSPRYELKPDDAEDFMIKAMAKSRRYQESFNNHLSLNGRVMVAPLEKR